MEKLKAWMKENGVKQSQLAKKIGCSDALVSRVFNGKSGFGKKNILKIADLTGIPADELMRAA